MFITRVFKVSLITATFIIAYLPITINSKIFERNQGGSVSYIAEEHIVHAI